MTLNFEWHAAKARSNLSKHGVSFETARLIFNDPHYVEMPRPDHCVEERIRIVALGAGSLLFVVFTWRGQNIRLISARKANHNESLGYWTNRHVHART
ncbi:BrnT family toxin [Luteibacter rhizovicinus]|uniref:BrnT family toxin n=1 Tax=Luteibacter rhizovicinus TaxID=242606 RepID=UPI00090438F7|nr:BrnT family toxin [Luteibacter rhizovicinus]